MLWVSSEKRKVEQLIFRKKADERRQKRRLQRITAVLDIILVSGMFCRSKRQDGVPGAEVLLATHTCGGKRAEAAGGPAQPQPIT